MGLCESHIFNWYGRTIWYQNADNVHSAGGSCEGQCKWFMFVYFIHIYISQMLYKTSYLIWFYSSTLFTVTSDVSQVLLEHILSSLLLHHNVHDLCTWLQNFSIQIALHSSSIIIWANFRLDFLFAGATRNSCGIGVENWSNSSNQL